MQSAVAGASMGPEFQEMSVGGGGVPSSIIGGVGERVPADKREKKKKKIWQLYWRATPTEKQWGHLLCRWEVCIFYTWN